ncbi:MAG: methionine--tRNA ligase [Candidatus Kapabacteria bacterium]|nr:methionine--tRNA ligase [Candidatus Kapabacteria bacterium]
MKRTLVTSALPYANGFIHLGHCAGAYLPADIYVRYLRLSGREVLWVCGSDEHGVAITIAADKEKTSPQQIIDKYHIANKEAFARFGMSFDIYSRTSLPIHHNTAREFFEDFLKKGILEEKEEEQFFDADAKIFLPDRYVEGICPNCGYDHARGDQCDNCGAYYNQLELKNPISLVSGKKPEVKKTTHWYFKFNEFQDFLDNYIESHSKDWKDNVLQQTRSWLKQGINPRPITRDLSWGVKIDGIDDLPPEKTNGKVLYVWFEAVLGYISITKTYYFEREYKGLEKADDWKKWWRDNETRYIAFIGKDNIVFHTLIFPALLKARGNNYILPDNVPANEFLNLEGQKFSKSRNWSIDLKDFIEDFPEPSFIDALRYTLAMNFPETRDSDFTWKDFQSRNNNELSAIFGNFVNRTLQFIAKNFDSEVPCLPDKYKDLKDDWKSLIFSLCKNYSQDTEFFDNIDESFKQTYGENDYNLLVSLCSGIKKISENYEKFRFRDAITETMNVARAANKYFNDEEPWKTLKTDPDKCAKTLYVCSQLVYTLSVLFSPIVPFSCNEIKTLLGNDTYTGEPSEIYKNTNFWNESIMPNLPEGLKINSPKILFKKIEDDVIEKQISKLGDKQQKPSAEEEELITIDYFKKVKLRTAKVISAENVKKSKKLIKLQVEISGEIRQIVAGIAEHYKPEELIGKTIVVVANLEPAKLMGEESRGMLLAANSPDGKLSVVTINDDGIPTGAEVR